MKQHWLIAKKRAVFYVLFEILAISIGLSSKRRIRASATAIVRAGCALAKLPTFFTFLAGKSLLPLIFRWFQISLSWVAWSRAAIWGWDRLDWDCLFHLEFGTDTKVPQKGSPSENKFDRCHNGVFLVFWSLIFVLFHRVKTHGRNYSPFKHYCTLIS